MDPQQFQMKDLIDEALRDFFDQMKIESVRVEYNHTELRAEYFLVLSSPLGKKIAKIGSKTLGSLAGLKLEADRVVQTEADI